MYFPTMSDILVSRYIEYPFNEIKWKTYIGSYYLHLDTSILLYILSTANHVFECLFFHHIYNFSNLVKLSMPSIATTENKTTHAHNTTIYR